MFVSIGETAVLLGVAIITLRRWDKAGVFCPSWRSPGLHRRYEMRKIKEFLGETAREPNENLTIGYARVSSFDQKEDLERQALRLMNVVKSEQNPEVMTDLGSGLNFKKKVTIQHVWKATGITHDNCVICCGAILMYQMYTRLRSSQMPCSHGLSSVARSVELASYKRKD